MLDIPYKICQVRIPQKNPLRYGFSGIEIMYTLCTYTEATYKIILYVQHCSYVRIYVAIYSYL